MVTDVTTKEATKFVCAFPGCGREFPRSVGLKIHMRNSHGAQGNSPAERPKPEPAPLDQKLLAIEEQMAKVTELVTSLAERVLEQSKPEEEKAQGYTPPSGLLSSDLSQMVPGSWRRVVDEILGSDFDVKVMDSAGGNFVIDIYLPKSLDRRVGDKTGQDHSTGMVRRATDLADVEHWCKLIRANIQKTYPNFKK